MGGYGYGMGLAREAMIPLMGQSPQPAMGQALSLAALLQNTQQERQSFPGQMQLQQQRIQGNQMALDQQRQQQQDEQTFKQALYANNGDWGAALNQVAGRVSPSYASAVMSQFAKAQDQLANWSKEQRAAFQDKQTRARGIYASLAQLQGPAFASALPQAQRALADIDPRYAQMVQPNMTPDQLRAGLGLTLGVEDKLLNLKPGETTGVMSPTGQFTRTFTAPTTPNVNDQELQAWLKKNPGKDASDFAAWKARLSRDPNAASDRQFREGQQSYQYSSTALDRVSQPIEQLVQRMGRLQDTLAQANPQADALVAPELLTVMAGGMGSGLRMNEAEISRIVGGRNNWESLKSAINKWQTDPSKPFLITPAQRGQINALLSEVGSKLQAKQQILDQARQDLANSNDPMQHRQILARARQRLIQIDGGQGGAPMGGGAAARGGAALSPAGQAYLNSVLGQGR